MLDRIGLTLPTDDAPDIDRRARERTRKLLPAFIDLVAFWIERSRQRRALGDLDDRLLRDIGITRHDAARECAKPFWR